jgi:hypothetical protein
MFPFTSSVPNNPFSIIHTLKQCHHNKCVWFWSGIIQVLWGIRLNNFSEGLNEKSESLATEITNNWLHQSTINRDQGPGMIKWLSHIIRTCIGCAMMCMRGSSVLVLCSPSLRAQFELACVFRLLFSGSKRAFNPRQGTNFWITYVTKVVDCTLFFRVLISNLLLEISPFYSSIPFLPNLSLSFLRLLFRNFFIMYE